MSYYTMQVHSLYNIHFYFKFSNDLQKYVTFQLYFQIFVSLLNGYNYRQKSLDNIKNHLSIHLISKKNHRRVQYIVGA